LFLTAFYLPGKSENLVSASIPIDGKTLATTNDLDIAKDGTIYFTDSSRYPLQDTLIEFLGEPSGRYECIMFYIVFFPCYTPSSYDKTTKSSLEVI